MTPLEQILQRFRKECVLYDPIRLPQITGTPEEIESFITEAFVAGEKEPHGTAEGYCCACEYDVAGMEEKVANARKKGFAAAIGKVKEAINNASLGEHCTKHVPCVVCAAHTLNQITDSITTLIEESTV